MCHLVLMAPFLGLGLFAVLPAAAAAPLYAVVLVASLWTYWSVYRVHCTEPVAGLERLPGSVGTIAFVLPHGFLVRMKGELWTADLAGPGRSSLRGSEAAVRQGTRVAVVGLDRNRLLVTPVDDPGLPMAVAERRY